MFNKACVISFLSLSAALIAGPAIAQNTDTLKDGIEKCKALSDKTEQEACADKLATETWNTSTSTDKLDGKRSAIAAIMSPDKVGKGQPFLAVRCLKNRTEMLINWPKFLGSRSHPVKWRIDDGPIVTERWSGSADGRAVFAANPIDTSKKMMGGKSEFVANVAGYGDTGTTVSFHLKGFDDAVKLIRAECRW